MRELKRLLTTQYLSRERLEHLQLRALRLMLGYASDYVPYYRKLWRYPPQVPTLADIASLPLLTKADVREAGAALVTVSPAFPQLLTTKTGGSTGTSLILKFDHAAQQHRNAAGMRSDMWAGWRPGDWTGVLWGTPEYPASLTQKLRNVLRDRLVFLDTMRLDAHSMGEFLCLMQRRRIDAIFGHAHSLFILADFALKHGYRVPAPHAIVSTSMMLLASERTVIEKAFHCSVSDRYGCEEVGLIAAECPEHSGYHVTSEHIIVEIVDERGKPCAPGEIGRVIVTDLQNHGMPLIRYEVGDLAAWAKRACPCGRSLPTLEKIVGRQADCLKRLDGSLVAGVSLVERTLLAIPGLAQLQLVQEAPDRLIAHAVLAPGATPKIALSELTRALERDLGVGIALDIEQVERIPQEKNGKYRFAIRRF